MSLTKSNHSRKILLILNNYQLDSINKIVLATIGNSPNFKFYILAIKDSGQCLADFKKLANVYLISQNKNLLRKLKDSQNLIKKEKINIIHCHNLKAESFAFMLKLKNPNLLLISNRHNYFFKPFSCKNLLKNITYFLFCHLSNQNIVVAKHLQKKLSNNLRINPQKICLIQNSVISPSSIKKQSRKQPKIVYFGQIIARKNLETLIEAAKILSRNTETLVIGQGKSLNNLKNLAKGQNNIKFLPFSSHPEKYYQAGDIFVLPSLSEGLSLSLLEAVQAGLLCVVSDIEANLELIDHQKNGLIFQAKNPNDLAKQLKKAIEHKLLLQKLTDQAKKDLKEKCSPDTMLAAYQKNYQKLFSSFENK